MRKGSTALTAIRRLLLVLLCALLLPAAAGAELKVVFMDVGQGDFFGLMVGNLILVGGQGIGFSAEIVRVFRFVGFF